ncbi:MAG: LacI family DNA-binding transcriptional regulator [Bacillota bacterium]
MVTIKEIAESLHVSTATVSNVIHGHLHKMSPDMAQQIREKLEEYHYIPNMGARMLAKGDSEIIGVITNYPNREEKLALQDPFVSELIGALENEIRTHHFFTLLYAAQNAQEINHIAQTWNTQGLIIMGLQADQCRALMRISQRPIVFVDCYFDEGEQYNNVGLDDFQGGYLMADYLIKLGHRRIAYIGDQPFLYGVDAHRLQGHRKALEERGLKWGEQSYLQISKDFKLRKADFERMLSRAGTMDTAWVFTSDYYAAEAVNFLADHEIKVPQQLTVTGFDDNMLAQMLRPRLTTVHQNVTRKAENAVRMLLELLEGNAEQPLSVRLPVRLVKGSTSGPPSDTTSL